MTDQRMAEYQEYYRARARRYENNRLYPATAVAERAICAAVEAADTVEQMQASVVASGLHLEAGRAFMRDQAAARAALYARTADDVRAQGPAEVLAKVDTVADAAGLSALGSSVEQRTQQAVTADELTRSWSSALTALENIEAWRTASVPQQWRADLDGYVSEAIASLRQSWSAVLAEAQVHAPGWRFSDDIAQATRHRRLVPLSDPTFAQRLGEHRTIVRGES